MTAEKIVQTMKSWIGTDKRKIIDIYNSHKPLARGYKVKYTDAWCDATVSACFIQNDAVDLIGGTECSVEKHIALFKQKGIWTEDGTITPSIGDIVTYNWDSHAQPNDGVADHIGVVGAVNAREFCVIEGNYNDAVKCRVIPIGWGYIRGFARPQYEKEVKNEKKEVKTVKPNGIDIASYQKSLDPAKVEGDFIIIKATQGTGYINPTYEKQADATLKAGKVLGLYHYANGSGVTGEVDFFLQTVKKYIGKAFLCLDWEHIPNGGANPQFKNPDYAKQFMDQVRKKTGLTMFIYGSKESCFNAMNWNLVKAAGYPCWGAQYPNYDPVQGYQQEPWQSTRQWGAWGRYPSIFQYTSVLRLKGYSGNLDGDLAYISLEALKGYTIAGTTGNVVSKPTEDTLNRAQLLQMVADTMDDKYGSGEDREKNLGKYYAQVQDVINYVDKTPADQLATDVLTGKFGNGEIREKVLGGKYAAVQKAVNAKLKGQKTVNEIAKEVIQGKWGNGSERVRKLRAAGYDSAAVQAEVNNLLGYKA